MNTKRLLKLAEFLETVPEERFDLSNWATGKLEDCNTAACAVGWACAIPEFKEAGLYLVIPEDADLCCCPKFCNLCGFDAVQSFFDLTRDQAEVFDVVHYLDRDSEGLLSQSVEDFKVVPKTVAAEIHKMVEKHEKEK